MKFIKKFFINLTRNTEPTKMVKNDSSKKIGGHDLDDKGGLKDSEKKDSATGPDSVSGEVKKKPGRPKGATAKKTPSKSTPSKKTPSKKNPPNHK